MTKSFQYFKKNEPDIANGFIKNEPADWSRKRNSKT